MIKNGRPYTDENGWVDDALITDLTLEEQEIISNWINDYLIPRESVNKELTSYSIKHKLEADTGIYLTNNQFKDAMLMEGYKPSNPNALNWTFGISKHSPVYDIYKY